MKIISWNVNSIKARMNSIEKLVKISNPDVLCLQETKTVDDNFPLERTRNLGYKYSVFKGQKSYNGVAILSKIPIKSHFFLNIYNNDARHICVNIGDLHITNLYVPAGGDIADADINHKFKHKIEFLSFIDQWFKKNISIYNAHILLGDFNIAPQIHDVWSSRALKNTVSHTQIERESLNRFRKNSNFIDIFRSDGNDSEKIFTWWSYRNKDWKKSNRGRRLDHIWVSRDLFEFVSSYEILKYTRDWDAPSDHVPCSIDMKQY
ncbi:MAG: exodeoxyribonuclease III [Rickettsia sp.]|nr:exodeoxyribonuclease III [Rickettsia sp.]